MDYLWRIYIDLHNASEGVLSYQEIDAYCRTSGELTPFEIEALRAINATYREFKNG